MSGTVILIGGGEDKGIEKSDRQEKNPFFTSEEILKTFCGICKSKDSKIAIITSASRIPDEIAKDYKKAFSKICPNQLEFIHIENKEEAADKENIKKLQSVNGVLFSGGSQARLTKILKDTAFLKELYRKFNEENMLVAGTSAGAMALPYLMIEEGSSEEGLVKGEVELNTGFNFVNGLIVDTHFSERGRFGRLAQAVCLSNMQLGIGISEDTALIIYPDKPAEIIGSGEITIINAKDIKFSNIKTIKKGEPLAVCNLRVNIVTCQYKYNLETGEIIKKD